MLCITGNITDVSELLLGAPIDLAKKMKTTLSETHAICAVVCRLVASRTTPKNLHENDEMFTSGDSLLDENLGGGIRTGMVWEIAGER